MRACKLRGEHVREKKRGGKTRSEYLYSRAEVRTEQAYIEARATTGEEEEHVSKTLRPVETGHKPSARMLDRERRLTRDRMGSLFSPPWLNRILRRALSKTDETLFIADADSACQQGLVIRGSSSLPNGHGKSGTS